MDKKESGQLKPSLMMSIDADYQESLREKIGVGLAYVTLSAYFGMCRIDDMRRNMFRKVKQYTTSD